MKKSRPKKRLLEKKITINGKRISVYGRDFEELAEKVRIKREEAEQQALHIFRDVADEWQDQHSPTIRHNTSFLTPSR
ncbi:MAG TPA: hypothetical protein GXZ23_03340 [Clostridiales bacterium]|nr:hypothetical protein [Clostridiales bacterium]